MSEVGGKAKALIETTREGFNVPEGFVLSTDFFSDWIGEIEAPVEWEQFLATPDRKTCERLKEAASQQRFSSPQKEQLKDALESVPSGMYAVRSSSHQEDLESISFAGLYETFLGVTREGIENAVRNVFLSMLDFRVVDGRVVPDTYVAGKDTRFWNPILPTERSTSTTLQGLWILFGEGSWK